MSHTLAVRLGFTIRRHMPGSDRTIGMEGTSSMYVASPPPKSVTGKTQRRSAFSTQNRRTATNVSSASRNAQTLPSRLCSRIGMIPVSAARWDTHPK